MNGTRCSGATNKSSSRCCNSLLVAAAATLACVVFGTMAALVFPRLRRRAKTILDGIVYLPLVIPEIVMAVAIVIFFSLLRMQLSLSTVIIAHITFCISYVIIVVGARLAGMDRSIEEAALDLGANEWTTFFRITLPIAAPAILSAALLVFTTSFDDYLITSFVAGVRSTTLPLEIYSRLKRGVTPEINAISTVILAATIPLVYIAQRLERGAMKVRAAVLSTTAVFLLMLAPVVARTWPSGQNLPQLNIYIWSTYVSPRLVQGFEREFHCKVNYDLYDSNEALLAKLQGGNVSYDLVVPSDYMVEILIRQGLLAPLDKSKLPNAWANIDRALPGPSLRSPQRLFGALRLGDHRPRLPRRPGQGECRELVGVVRSPLRRPHPSARRHARSLRHGSQEAWLLAQLHQPR